MSPRAVLGASLLLLAATGTSAKVKVDFYGEALCPYCALFLANTVAPLFAQDFSPYMDFRYVAYGNAKNTSHGLECQHGSEECTENRVLLCATDSSPNWFPFALCLSQNHSPDAVKVCADAAKLDYANIKSCSEGELGSSLVRSAARETAELDPPHTYVPWVVVNGVAIGNAYSYLRSFICVALGSGDKPRACSIPGSAAHSLRAPQPQLM